MATSELMDLEIWPADFLLPSVDAQCLQAFACLRFCAAPINLVRATSPWTTPEGTYPVFKSKDATYSNVNQLIPYLQEKATNFPLDSHLSAVQRAEITAYDSLLKLKLVPAYLYTLWMDVPNYNVFTSRWYGNQLPIGYGLYYVAKTRHSVSNYLHTLYPGKLTEEENIEFAVTKQALLCINLLSSKLGDKKYFFGDKPSSLDALVFGYLAPLLKLPLPNDRLQQHIKACPNLVRFIDSVMCIYMPLSDEEMTTHRAQRKEWEKRKDRAQFELQKSRQKAKESQDGTSEDEFPLRHKIMFGIGALILSLFIAVHAGLIQVEVREVNRADTGNNE